MSQFYFTTQRAADIQALKSMFGDPWNEDSLGTVLDFFNGDVDKAISKLLVLNEDQKGNMLRSGPDQMISSSREPIPTRSNEKYAVKPVTLAPTLAPLPNKKNLKKAPPPRKIQVVATMADTFQPALITIEKTTRRKIGIQCKLPKDFLRIPKMPLFPPHHMEMMKEIEPIKPSSPQPSTSSSLLEKSTNSQVTESTSTFQSFRNNFSFPGFTRNENGTQQQKNNPTSNRLGKFSVPKISAPVINMPRIQLRGKHGDASETAQSQLFADPKEDAWSDPLASASSPIASSDSASTSDTTRVESQSSSSWNLTGGLISRNLGASVANPSNNSGNDNNSRWSLPSVSIPSLGSKKVSSAYLEESENQVDASSRNNPSRWSLASVGASLRPNTTPGTDTLNGREDRDNKTSLSSSFASAKEQSPLSAEGKRWSLPALGSPLQISTKTDRTPNMVPKLSGIHEETYDPIAKIEHRGVTLQQLQKLVDTMQQHCLSEQWKSTKSGKGLRPKDVTMYDLTKHFLLPQTLHYSCSYVEAVYGKHNKERGLVRAHQWFVCHAWNDSVVHVVDCLQQHAADRCLDHEHTLYWICALAMNQHTFVSNAMTYADTLDDTSLQNPIMTKKVMQAATQGMVSIIDKKNSIFNRTWCLWEMFLGLQLSTETIMDSSCFLVDVYTTNEEGVAVGIVDGVAEADMYRLSRNDDGKDVSTPPNIDKKLDVFSFRKQQPCNQVEWSGHRAVRQSQFRFAACLELLDASVEISTASIEEDTRRIMNCIVTVVGGNANDSIALEAEALTAHPAYTHVDSMLKGKFAGVAYRSVLEDASSPKAGDLEQHNLKRMQTYLAASPIESLAVSFAGCAAFQIREALKFVESLPTSLRYLDLDYSFLDFQYGEEFAIGFGRLQEKLQVFKLNCAYCSKLENLDRLWAELGKLVHLRHLVLIIHPNKKLTSVDGLSSALFNMRDLERLELVFDSFGEYSKVVAVAKGGATLNSISSGYRNMIGKPSEASRRSEELSQQFDKNSKMSGMDINGAYIDDASIQRLCRGLASSTRIKTVRLRFLGEFGKKLQNVESIEELQQTLQRARNGLKLFS